MFTKEDMLARLMKGEDAEAIAKEMTDALNAAITEAKKAEEEKAKKEAEERAKKEVEAKLDGLAAEMIKLMKAYIEVKAPGVLEGHEDELLDVKSFRDTIDGALKMITVFGDSMSKLEGLFEMPEVKLEAPKVGGIIKAKGKTMADMTEEEMDKVLDAFCNSGFTF